MYLAQRKQSKSMCRYTCIYSHLLMAVMSVFKSTMVQYGYPYSITVWTISYGYGVKPYSCVSVWCALSISFHHPRLLAGCRSVQNHWFWPNSDLDKSQHEASVTSALSSEESMSKSAEPETKIPGTYDAHFHPDSLDIILYLHRSPAHHTSCNTLFNHIMGTPMMKFWLSIDVPPSIDLNDKEKAAKKPSMTYNLTIFPASKPTTALSLFTHVLQSLEACLHVKLSTLQ